MSIPKLKIRFTKNDMYNIFYSEVYFNIDYFFKDLAGMQEYDRRLKLFKSSTYKGSYSYQDILLWKKQMENVIKDHRTRNSFSSENGNDIRYRETEKRLNSIKRTLNYILGLKEYEKMLAYQYLFEETKVEKKTGWYEVVYVPVNQKSRIWKGLV